MIFQPVLAHKILAGSKSMTRRPVHPDDIADKSRDGTILQVRRQSLRRGQQRTTVRYRVATPLHDSTYGVQPGRGKPSEFRIRLTGIRQERLGAITFEDARAEGFRTREDFAAYWLTLHDPLPAPQEDCCVVCGGPALVLGCCLTCGTEDQDAALATLTTDFFAARQADRPVWVLSFELVRDSRDRWLAARPSPDYVSSPSAGLPGEPPAVDEDSQERITARAGAEHAQWKALEERTRQRDRELVAAEDRIKVARTLARQRNVNIERELFLLRNRLQRGAGPESLTKRIEAVERKVDRWAA